MSERLAFTIAGPPRGKARPRATARVIWQDGKPRAIVTVYSDPATEAAEREILALFLHRWPNHRPWTGAVQLRFTAIFPVPEGWSNKLHAAAATGKLFHTSKPDKDNIEKLIVDALNGWAWCDDAQVMGGGVKRYGSPARIDVILEPLASPDMPITPAVKGATERLAAGKVRPQPKGSKSKAPKSESRSPLQLAIDKAVAREPRR